MDLCFLTTYLVRKCKKITIRIFLNELVKKFKYYYQENINHLTGNILRKIFWMCQKIYFIWSLFVTCNFVYINNSNPLRIFTTYSCLCNFNFTCSTLVLCHNISLISLSTQSRFFLDRGHGKFERSTFIQICIWQKVSISSCWSSFGWKFHHLLLFFCSLVSSLQRIHSNLEEILRSKFFLNNQ